MATQAEILIQGTYNTLYNAITRPDRKFVVSHYFLDEWLPILGPSLAWLVVALRQRCYWNKRNDWCIVDKATLARETAMQERTIERCLKKPFNQFFILEVAHRYRYRNDLGKKVRDKNRYHLLLDDPLSPRHQVGLADLLQELMPDIPDPVDAALAMVQRLIDDPYLSDKISGKPKIDKRLPRRTVLELVTDALAIELADYAGDERLVRLDQRCAHLHNKITQPNKVYVGWQYFRLQWLEHLGHALAWVVVNLRRRCFWDDRSGELRDECRFFKKDLAAGIGQTPRNLTNLLDNPHQHLFFNTVSAADDQGPKSAGRGPIVYRVRLVDEPLTPADQQRIADELNQRLQGLTYGIDQEDGQLNLFPILDRVSSRQDFAYGQISEEMSAREGNEGRLGEAEDEILPARQGKKRRLGEAAASLKAEDLSDRQQKKSREDNDAAKHSPRTTGKRESLLSGEVIKAEKTDSEGAEQPENLSDREQESRVKTEEMSVRWLKEGRLAPETVEDLSDRPAKKGRLDDLAAEKMSQHDEAESGKNVATLKDSLKLLTTTIEPQPKNTIAAADLKDELVRLSIQEPILSQLMAKPGLNGFIVRAWALYAETQPGLERPISYVIRRLQVGDSPPANFLRFAELNEQLWRQFEETAQALYFGQSVTVEFEPSLFELFVAWAGIYSDLDPLEVRQLLGASGSDQTGETGAILVEVERGQGEQLWQLTLERLKLQMTRSIYDMWLRPTTVLRYEAETLIIGVQSEYARDWLAHRLLAMIERTLHNVAGRAIQVRFEPVDRRQVSVG